MPRRYIGGTTNLSRQKYYDIDTELTSLIKEIALLYQLNPNLLASRIADEGPIDLAIRNYNLEGPYNGWLLTQSAKRLNEDTGEYEDGWGDYGRFYYEGQNWGLDDLDSRINTGDIKILGDYSNYALKNHPYDFENEVGRITKTRHIPTLRYGIEATAAELLARRNKMIQNNPNMSGLWYDAAAAASFNYGEQGVKKFGKNIPSKFNPYIVLKRRGGLIPKHQEGNLLPTAQPANERYKGGLYGKITNTNPYLNYSFGYFGFPRLTDYEVIVGNDGNIIYSNSLIGKGFDYSKGDSVAIEIPKHIPISVSNTARPVFRSRNPKEFKRLRRRFDEAKSVVETK